MDCVLRGRNSGWTGRYRRCRRLVEYWDVVRVCAGFTWGDFPTTQAARAAAGFSCSFGAVVPADFGGPLRRIDDGAYCDYLASLCCLASNWPDHLLPLQPQAQRIR